MKLALAFLFGFVLVKCQPQVYSLNPKFFNPLLYNGQRALNNPSSYHFQSPQYGAIFFSPYGPLGDGGFQDHEENESRYNLNKNKLTSGETDLVGVPRLFLNFASTGSSVPPVGQFLFRTVISTAVITTTVASVSKCIPAAQFSAAKPTPCARRKREIVEFFDKLILSGNDAQENLAPTSVEKVETTAVVKHDALGSRSRGFQSTDLLSSKEDDENVPKRSKRFFNLLAVTTTITSFSFVTSTVAKTVSLVTAAAALGCVAAADTSCLICIPEGYGVCA